MARRLRRIVFIRTDRLGETLLNLPAVAALAAALPDASVSLLVHPELAPLLRAIPGLGGVLTAPTADGAWWARAWRLGRSLSRHRFDCAIVSNPKKELHAAVWLAGIPVRVGYGRKWGCLLTRRLDDRKALGERHEVEYNLDLIRALGLPAQALPWRFPPFSGEQAEVFRLPELRGLQPSEPLIAVHPFSSNPLKRWPAERYRELIRRLALRVDARVVVVGGAEERELASAVLPPETPAVNLVGRLTLRQLAALFQRARLLVSNDSGPVHLAAAVGTRTVVLFGSTHPAAGPARWGPWGPGHTVIAKSRLEEITVEQAMDAISEILACPSPAAS
jgi:heptosyltransferase-2